jgi:Domain of unknown function (DUF5916)/Carbohydrate family 9 binding domain-like
MVAPVLDGMLDDELWSGPPMPIGTWMSYNPLRGEPEQQQTLVWIGYDDQAIYFAFHCRDTEPKAIRTTISRRDTAWNDDWVALSLDSSRAGQIAYHMFVNPSGVQMDALNSAASGEDSAADWRWDSAGRVDEDGYSIEVRVPLESLRFRGGTDVSMGVMFFRRISRLGVSWSWPEMPPGTWVFEAHVPVVFSELNQPRLLEVIPSATVSRNQTRGEDHAWREPTAHGDVGVSIKYGVTSTITLDGTINPDFSQVESDAFQVEVNERFPVFFSEKRTFFMEGLGLFNLAGTGDDSSMRTAVHTRRIVDPLAGIKLTGTAGQQTFGLLSAVDESTGEISKRYTVGRGVRNFGNGQYAGVLVSDTEFASDYNRVIGGDVALRHGEHFRWNASALSSSSRSTEQIATHGGMAQVSYNYSTQRATVGGQLEHFSDDFRMDTAFFNQSGLTRTWQYGELQFYPDDTGTGWLKRVAPFVWATRGDNRLQGGSEQFALAGLRLNFTRQGNLRVDIGRGHETFVGQRFTVGHLRIEGSAQFLRWLNVGGNLFHGPAIFYEPTSPFQGTRTSTRLSVGFQPSANLNHDLTYDFVDFAREDTSERVFRLHIVNLRNTYQFNRQFFLRLISQLDTSRRRVLNDALASYELVPGTVVHLGYGAILEGPDRGRYAPTARALFFKASYLTRF